MQMSFGKLHYVCRCAILLKMPFSLITRLSGWLSGIANQIFSMVVVELTLVVSCGINAGGQLWN